MSMRLGDLIDSLIARLGERPDLEDLIIQEFKLAQYASLESGSFKPWFMLSEASTAPAAVGEERVPIPHDFMLEYEEGGVWVILSEYDKELEKDDLDNLRARYRHNQPGVPSYYALAGEYIRLFPAPVEQWRLRMLYWRRLPTLSTREETNLWLRYAFDLCLAETGYRVASATIDKLKMQEFAQERQQAWQRLYVEHEARDHTNRGYQRGSR